MNIHHYWFKHISRAGRKLQVGLGRKQMQSLQSSYEWELLFLNTQCFMHLHESPFSTRQWPVLCVNCFYVIRKVIFPVDVSWYLRCKYIDKQTVFIPRIGFELKHSILWCDISLFEGITYSFPCLCWLWSLQVRTHCLVKAIERKVYRYIIKVLFIHQLMH